MSFIMDDTQQSVATVPKSIPLNMDSRSRIQKQKEAALLTRIGRLMAIGGSCAALPEQDTRQIDDILGYTNQGLPS